MTVSNSGEQITSKGGMRWMRSWPLLLIGVAVVVALMYNASLESKAEVGKAAPNFTLATPAGEELRLADLRGQPVFLNFWATWCEVCHEAIPAWQAFAERYGDRVEIVNVNVREGNSLIRRYHENFASRGLDLTMTVVRDQSGRVSDQYRLWAVPETWVIDAEGVARGYQRGPYFFEEMQNVYEMVTGQPIDAGGIGPVAEGGALYRLGFAPDGLWTATSAGLAQADVLPNALQEAEGAKSGLHGQVATDIQSADGKNWFAVVDGGLWRYGDSEAGWQRIAGLPDSEVIA